MAYEIYMTSNFWDISGAKMAIYIVFSTFSATDLVIALMMYYYLQKSRAATSVSSTASRLLSLMRIVLMSGLATSACSLLTLITYIVWPNTLIFLGIKFVVPKLYINSLLAMLNYRRKQHEVDTSNAGRPAPAVFRIAPHSTEDSTPQTNIHFPLSKIQDVRPFEEKLDRSEGNPDYNPV
ncbi:uncharacterized protein ARMOST_18872 [Armillaria ostoyae]|uniref:DUF6534 domain-containing protein n=1 Tax=Armillaria ostoyae TaxID=47428 RepID=A0A284S336_ARMOS|nr:uncharacterized protein ARMOST_18872 [Armillaria ostoyae]